MGMGMNMAAVGAVVGATPIVSLAEAVVPEELTNDEEYQDIMDDMRDECGKVSTIQAMTQNLTVSQNACTTQMHVKSVLVVPGHAAQNARH